MEIVHSIETLRQQVKLWRREGERIALVATMGNLHEGHLRLVNEARAHADRIIVSIFVNPTQFVAGEDFATYPRTLEEDRTKLADINTDLLFSPSIDEIYGANARTTVSVSSLSNLYCGVSRPGHFSGVATIVCKLFNMVQPDVALFGEKDFQQLAVIRCMTRDLNIPVRIVGVATVRETDGLAMSSRNSYLTEQQRQVAPTLFQSLVAARRLILQGETNYMQIAVRQKAFLQQAGFKPEYYCICRAQDLLPANYLDSDLVILVAAQLGKARLIDNIQVKKN